MIEKSLKYIVTGSLNALKVKNKMVNESMNPNNTYKKLFIIYPLFSQDQNDVGVFVLTTIDYLLESVARS